MSSCSGLAPSGSNSSPSGVIASTPSSLLVSPTPSISFSTPTTYAASSALSGTSTNPTSGASGSSQGTSGLSAGTGSITSQTGASPVTTGGNSQNSSSPITTGGISQNSSSPITTGGISQNSSSPITTGGSSQNPSSQPSASGVSLTSSGSRTSISTSGPVTITTMTTTIYITGSASSTTTVTGTNGQPTVEYFIPIRYVNGGTLTSDGTATTQTLGTGATETIVQVVPTPGCPGQTTYNQYYSGTGLTLDASQFAANDPADYSNPIVVAPYPASSYSVAAANSACACQAYGVNYPSYELYFSRSNSTWNCVIYTRANSNTSYFSIANSDATQVYGYSQPIATLSSCSPSPHCADYYQGSGVDIVPNSNTLGNATSPPSIASFYQNGGYTITQVLDACACDTYHSSYQSYDLHFNLSSNQWNCTAYSYFNPGTQTNLYTTPNDTNVGTAYGCNIVFD